MTRDQIITEVYNSDMIKNISNVYRSILGNYRKDFISYMYELLCNIPEEKLIQLYNDQQLNYYLYYIGKAQSNNKNSDFWKIHKGRINIDGSIDDYDYYFNNKNIDIE